MAQPETKKNQKYKNKRRATRERRGRDAEATLEKEKGQVEKGVLEEALPADQAPKGTGQPERPTALDPHWQAEMGSPAVTNGLEKVAVATTNARFVPMTIGAQVGEVHIRPLVDTGAGISLIHAATVERLLLQGVKCVVRKCRTTPVMGVGGEELITLGVVRLPITVGVTTRSIDLRVVPTCPASVLLGTGALHDFGFTIHFERRVLTMPDGHEVPFTTTDCEKTLFGVFLAEDISLEPMTVTKLHVRVAEGPERWEEEEVNLLVEETSMGHCLKAARVARSLVSSWRDDQDRRWAITSMANFSHHRINLSAGTPVGEAEEVESDWTCAVLGDSLTGQEAAYQGCMTWEP